MTRAVPFCRSVERRRLIIKGHLILIEAKKKKKISLCFSLNVLLWNMLMLLQCQTKKERSKAT